MREFWTDHGEAVVTTILGALVGLLASYAFYRAGKERKELVWQVEVDEWLVGRSAPPGLQVSYEGVELKHPRLVAVSIYNAGTKGIQADHLIEPVRVTFPGAKIQSATYEPIRMIDPAPPLQRRHAEDSEEITKLRMNPGDGFNLRFLVDGGKRFRVSVEATLFEQTSDPIFEPEPIDPTPIWALLMMAGVCVAFGALAATGGVYTLADWDEMDTGQRFVGPFLTLIAAFGAIGITRAVARDVRRQGRLRRLPRLKRPTAFGQDLFAEALAESMRGRTIDEERRPGA